MSTYRCLSCLSTYDSMQGNYKYFHVCPEGTENPRNENLIFEGLIKNPLKTYEFITKTRIKLEGKGREQV